MNDLDIYLNSGLIEAYCLGNLTDAEAADVSAMASKHAAVREAVEQTMAVLEQYPQRKNLRPELKNKVMSFLDGFLADETIDLHNLPLIHLHSDINAWNRALKDIKPDFEEPGLAARVLKETDEVLLSVVWLSEKMVEDKHHDDEFLESFLILEGACECDFEGEIVRFSAGDYFDIPPNTQHVIKNISEGFSFVKGLVQRRKAA